jgi:phosphoserine phosphatase
MLSTSPQWHYLIASDFDQTLSFNDSGFVLSDLIGVHGFDTKVAALADRNLVQQGGELAYLLLHDPDYRCVRRDHLAEVGRRIRLKRRIRALIELLSAAAGGDRVSFHVISAAPEEVIVAALDSIIDPRHIHGTRFEYGDDGAIVSLVRVSAGYGKVAALDRLRAELGVSDDRVVYVGDGGSDVHVMLDVNRRGGLTISVSEAKQVAQIARRTVLGEDALAVAVPILEQMFGWEAPRIREFFAGRQLLIEEWSKVHTDLITIRTDNRHSDDASVRKLADG